MSQQNEFPKNHPPLAITTEQSKLLANALRLKIMHLLAETPRTAKQVAELLGKTPGNVHYHIQRLYEGKLLELVETRTVGSIVEKYYRSLGTSFHPERFLFSQFVESTTIRIGTHLLLTPEEAEQFAADLSQLLNKWEAKELHGADYAVEIVLGQVQQEQNQEPNSKEESSDEP